ncbi:FAD-dependent oxidoreductase [Rugosimonospora acidiphila]|uniref:FAD-dependent oxidoreductase n=1 Tax=Rugosimonospora acidiphila TaxID=556531 RepID=A0ABP9SK39_9ACTN
MRSAVVVGAGIGGLAAAGALARTGWEVTLLERGDRLRGDSAALLIWPNGVRALRAMDLSGGLNAIASPAPSRGIRRPSGQWMVQPDDAVERDADASVVVHREDLHDTLVAGLGDKIDIRTGVQVRAVRCEPGEQPSVSDGRSTWQADFVVAADGLDSVVRRRLVPESSVVAAGCAAWRAVIPWYRAPKLPADGAGTGGETLGAGHRFRYALLGEPGSAGVSGRGGVYWAATVPGASRPEPPATQLSLLRRWFAGWHAPIGDLLAATEPDDLIQHPVAELRPLPRAFSFPAGPGGFVLLGDAAHAMSPHLSQGACLALEDAATLRVLLKDAIPGRTLQGALDAYSRARRPRLARILRQSRRVGAVYSANGTLAVRARDAALGLTPNRLLGRASDTVRQWRPPA